MLVTTAHGRLRLFSWMAAAALLAAGAASPPAPAQDGSSEDAEIALLFNETARGGSLRALEGEPDRFVLTLRRPGRQVVWFQDRPSRHSGHMPLEAFVESWAGYGFVTDPPNAALSVLDADDHEDVVVLTLGRPRYRPARETLRFPVRIQDEATGNLAHLEPHRDAAVRESFGPAALFIDDASARVIDGCVIQPRTECPGANLMDADLRNADLRGASLQRARLVGSAMQGANLSGADLTGADVRGYATAAVFTALDGADLSGADLSGANLSGAGLERANLREVRMNADTNLSYASLIEADLTRARAAGVSLFQAIVTGARFVDADLRGADLNRVGAPRIQGEEPPVQGVDFTSVDLRDASLGEAYLENSKLFLANLNGIKADGIDLVGSDLHLATLREAWLVGGDLRDTDIAGTDLARSNLSLANLAAATTDANTSFEGAKFCRTGMPDGSVRNPLC
jgi:uncharacterized protein YjbI with pentapeptide repeats